MKKKYRPCASPSSLVFGSALCLESLLNAEGSDWLQHLLGSPLGAGDDPLQVHEDRVAFDRDGITIETLHGRACVVVTAAVELLSVRRSLEHLRALAPFGVLAVHVLRIVGES